MKDKTSNGITKKNAESLTWIARIGHYPGSVYGIFIIFNIEDLYIVKHEFTIVLFIFCMNSKVLDYVLQRLNFYTSIQIR